MKRFCLGFDFLNTRQVYDILALRSEVFVIEQNCIYQDIDNKDLLAHHLFYYSTDSQLIAYARLLPAGVSYPQASIGRILVRQSNRQDGIGKLLVEDAISTCQSLWPETGITIGAQCYLKNFYQTLGFESIDDEYLEDGIPHVDMRYNP